MFSSGALICSANLIVWRGDKSQNCSVYPPIASEWRVSLGRHTRQKWESVSLSSLSSNPGHLGEQCWNVFCALSDLSLCGLRGKVSSQGQLYMSRQWGLSGTSHHLRSPFLEPHGRKASRSFSEFHDVPGLGNKPKWSICGWCVPHWCYCKPPPPPKKKNQNETDIYSVQSALGEPWMYHQLGREGITFILVSSELVPFAGLPWSFLASLFISSSLMSSHRYAKEDSTQLSTTHSVTTYSAPDGTDWFLLDWPLLKNIFAELHLH